MKPRILFNILMSTEQKIRCTLFLFLSVALVYDPQVRLLYADDPPGVVITSTKDFKSKHISDPSLALLPNRRYIASQSYEGKGVRRSSTEIFESKDQGKSWHRISLVEDVTGGTLFVRKNELYLLGLEKRPGSPVVKKSDDGGKTWSSPTKLSSNRHFGTSTPVSHHSGRIWRTYHFFRDPHYQICVFSADENADLMNPSSWTISNSVMIPKNFFTNRNDTFFKGSVLARPDGQVVCITSLGSGMLDRAGYLPVSKDGSKLTFLGDESLIGFPGGGTKFTIRYDPSSEKYWTIVNKQLEPYARFNIVALCSSSDLRNWEVNSILMRHYDSIWHGFSKIDWQFQGDDLAMVGGISWGSGNNAPQHLGFQRIENFRSRTRRNDAPWLGERKDFIHETSELKIQGMNCRIAKLTEGCTAYTNFTVRFNNIPDRFKGWLFTRTKGGTLAMTRVEAKRDTTIYLSTTPDADPIDLTGWKIDDMHAFRRGKSNPQAVFKRELKRGEHVYLPQGNWGGSSLLFRPN